LKNINLGFYPPEETLMQMRIDQLREARLRSFLYRKSQSILRLTFGFDKGLRSPPPGSYLEEPCEESKLPEGTSLGKLVFSLHKHADGSMLLSRIECFSHVDHLTQKIEGTNLIVERQTTLDLKPTEVIVSARVDTNGTAPLNVQFMVVNLL
jgi:hypothetical protein